jgi:hypothetical protein
MYILSYETLANSIKESTQQMGKERTMRMDSSLSQKKTQSGSQRGKGTNYVLNTPPIARSILKKRKG